MYLDSLFDKFCSISTFTTVNTRWTDIPVETILYDNIRCDYYLAPRWNVVNWLKTEAIREQDKDRMDLVISWDQYDPLKPILQWQIVIIKNQYLDEWWKYQIDQLDYYQMPDWSLENIYIRLNQVR